MTWERRRLALAAVLTVVGLSGSFLFWRASQRKHARELRSGSPYANTQLGVNYVGDPACVPCHAGIAESYRRHPMGRSLFPIVEAASPGADPGTEDAQFDANGSRYSVEHQGNRVIHQETRRDRPRRVAPPVRLFGGASMNWPREGIVGWVSEAKRNATHHPGLVDVGCASLTHPTRASRSQPS